MTTVTRARHTWSQDELRADLEVRKRQERLPQYPNALCVQCWMRSFARASQAQAATLDREDSEW